MQAANQLLVRSLMFKNAAVLSRAYHAGGGHHIRPTSMNDMPVPKGDWQEQYQQKQAKYNAQLAGSVLLFFGILGYMKQSKIVDFNWSPPKTYE